MGDNGHNGIEVDASVAAPTTHAPNEPHSALPMVKHATLMSNNQALQAKSDGVLVLLRKGAKGMLVFLSFRGPRGFAYLLMCCGEN